MYYLFVNKPDGEGQIPYDLTYGTQSTEEKSKQNIDRDIEVNNNLTMGRGEWGEDSEERGLQELL